MPAVTPERDQIERLVRGEHHEPHRLLGAHLDGDQVTIRVWRPDATGVVALVGDERVTLAAVHPAGLFEAVFARSEVPAYRLEVGYGDRTFTVDDPYRFLAHHRGARPAPARRGPPRAVVAAAGRARDDP
jgi:1,4-alpha-glucan branching enzyme